MDVVDRPETPAQPDEPVVDARTAPSSRVAAMVTLAALGLIPAVVLSGPELGSFFSIRSRRAVGTRPVDGRHVLSRLDASGFAHARRARAF